MKTNIKIYLVDDHQVLIDGMKALLKTKPNFEMVGFSLNGLNIFEKVIESKANILVMDINMPEKDGLEVLKELAQKEKLPFKVIVLSSYDELKLVREVMKLGALGYLTKQCAGENIVEAILEVHNGKEYFCKNIREKIFNSFTTHQKTHQINSNLEVTLTERELAIIKLISLEYSGKEIGEELFISIHTVESHRRNLIKKLNVKGSVGLVKYAVRHNLIEN